MLVAAALPFSTAAGAQYGSELGKLAPEAMKGGAKPRPMQVKQIAPDLYFFWNDGSSNAMFLVTDEGVLVVDSQQRRSDARRLLGLIRKVTDQPVKQMMVTHAHGDVSTRATCWKPRRNHRDGEVQPLPELPPHARLGSRAAPPAHHRQADGAVSLRVGTSRRKAAREARPQRPPVART